MGEEKFSAILCLMIPKIIQLIMENYPYDEITAANKFYSSDVYAVLEDEESKVWHFSPLTLFQMFDEEEKTGTFIFPEEV